MKIDHIDMYHEQWINPESREIWIQSIEVSSWGHEGEEPGFEYMNCNKIIRNLHILLDEDPDAPILIHMHTIGGEWSQAMAVYDMIKSIPGKVIIVAYAHARSMSSVILQAGDVRIMMPNAYFLMHWGESFFAGTSQQAISNAKWEARMNKQMVKILAGRAKITKAMIKNLINSEGDAILDADLAVMNGLADRVFTSWEDVWGEMK